MSDEKLTPEAPKSVDALVDSLIESVKGYNAKFNHEKTLSVIDLAARGGAQGTTYRQLHVAANQGYMEVSLIEGFKSSHGGNSQTKTLRSVVVPVLYHEAYGKMQKRFFGYDEAKQLGEGKVLLDMIVETKG